MELIDTKDVPRWIVYTAISSLLCVLGVLTVPVVSLLVNQKRENINTKLLNYGLSMSAGSMLMTSLYKILPKSTEKNKYSVTFGCLVGVFLSLFLNFIVHACTSESLVHCAHGNIESDEEEHEHAHGHEHEHEHEHEHRHGQGHRHRHGQGQGHEDIGENTCFDSNEVIDHVALNPTHSVSSSHTHGKKKASSVGAGILNKKKSFLDLIKKDFLVGECQPNTCDINNTAILLEQLTPGTLPQIKNVDQTRSSNSFDLNNGSMCLENTIGYDLKNLEQYRNNYFQKLPKYSDIHREDIDSENSTTEDEEEQEEVGDEHGDNIEQTNSPESAPLMRHFSNGTHGSRHTHGYHSINSGHKGYSAFYTELEGAHEDDHHHHIETPFSKLVSIGLQTCVVLTLHKLPEGLILYFTNKNSVNSAHNGGASSKLGVSIFISLAIHNFIEGFAMCLPLYTALSSKMTAILSISLLAGGSQPLGAFLGYLIDKHYGNRGWLSNPDSDAQTLLLSVTSGFLFVISLQMFQTAVGFSDAHSHEVQVKANQDAHSHSSHHHEEHQAQPENNHTAGTTCVKWCCFGALLVLFSGLFV